MGGICRDGVGREEEYLYMSAQPRGPYSSRENIDIYIVRR